MRVTLASSPWTAHSPSLFTHITAGGHRVQLAFDGCYWRIRVDNTPTPENLEIWNGTEYVPIA